MKSFALFIVFLLSSTVAWGHSGQLSKKDQCHNMYRQRKVVERHWHETGTYEKGGLCVDGKQMPPPLTKRELKTKVKNLEQRLLDSTKRENVAYEVENSLRAEMASAEWKYKRNLRNAENEVVAAQHREGVMERKLQDITVGAPVCTIQRAAMGRKVQAGTWGARGWRDEANNLMKCLSAEIDQFGER